MTSHTQKWAERQLSLTTTKTITDTHRMMKLSNPLLFAICALLICVILWHAGRSQLRVKSTMEINQPPSFSKREQVVFPLTNAYNKESYVMDVVESFNNKMIIFMPSPHQPQVSL